jgi:hypothetical protein
VRSFSNNPPCAAFLFLSAAQANAARIEVPGVLAAVPAGDLLEWAALIRNNPPPRTLIAAGRVVPQPNGQRAASVMVWLEPPRLAP